MDRAMPESCLSRPGPLDAHGNRSPARKLRQLRRATAKRASASSATLSNASAAYGAL
jgi:hypothetical protein